MMEYWITLWKNNYVKTVFDVYNKTGILLQPQKLWFELIDLNMN